jgi:RNA polymerase sigma-70 factor (ECF subfamily)
LRGSDASFKELTDLLRRWGNGDSDEAERVFPLIYGELRRQAHSFLRRERPGHTLQTTALINETYLKLREQTDVEWESRAHFFAICATLMRRILVDYARARKRAKRGGGAEQLPIEGLALAADAAERSEVDLIALDDALDRLANIDLQQSRVVELRFFSGLSIEETADLLGKSTSSVKRDWRTAKAWLFNELSSEGST